MSLLTEYQKEQIQQTFKERYGSCQNCQSYEGKNINWMVPHEELGDALLYILGDLNIDIQEEMEDSIVDLLPRLVSELDLYCPKCNSDWNYVGYEIGQCDPNESYYSDNLDEELDDELDDESDEDEVDVAEQLPTVNESLDIECYSFTNVIDVDQVIVDEDF